MARMQEIEASVREHDAEAVTLGPAYARADTGEGADLSKVGGRGAHERKLVGTGKSATGAGRPSPNVTMDVVTVGLVLARAVGVIGEPTMASGGRRRGKGAESALRVELGGVTSEVIGSQAGLPASEIEFVRARLTDSIRRLDAERDEGRRPFLEMSGGTDALAAMTARARELRGKLDWVVVVAGEGSTLGSALLVDALASGLDGPHFLEIDGANPTALRRVLDRVEPSRALFHVIERSGENVETLAAFLVLRDRLVSALGAVDYAGHLLVTTDPDAGPLRQIVNDEGLHSSDFPAGVLGHQTATSPHHLLGAQLLGVDVAAYLDGVAEMDARCRGDDPATNPAAALALVSYLLATLHGIRTSVLLSYDDALAGFAEWWRHLWAATLGKKLEGESSSVSVGLTPVVARGTLDQYTQMQMYLDGPADKLCTFLSVRDVASPIQVPASFRSDEDIGFLGGRTIEDVSREAQRAARVSLARAQRPSIAIELARLDANSLGQLVRLFESAALLCASLHDVDPQARPGVESARRVLLGLLERSGGDGGTDEVGRLDEAVRERWVV